MSRDLGWPLAVIVITFAFDSPPAHSTDIHWNGNQNNNWHDTSNWNGGAVPTNGDTATLATPAGDSVVPTAHVFGINDLHVSNGITISSSGFFLNVDDLGNAETVLSGVGTRLTVPPRSSPSLLGFATETLLLQDGASVSLTDGHAQADVGTNISPESFISGYGLFEFGNDFTPEATILTNNGTIFANKPAFGFQDLTLRVLGQGERNYGHSCV